MNNNNSIINTNESVNKNSDESVLIYESDRYCHRYPCYECGSTNVYTRIYFHEKMMKSHYLCYNCADDYIQYRGYELLTVPFNQEVQK